MAAAEVTTEFGSFFHLPAGEGMMGYFEKLSPQSTLVGVAVSTFIVATVLRTFLFGKRGKNLPPGPRPWPILGNLPMFSDPAGVHHTLEELARVYGPVYTLWMGAFPTIIVSGLEATREALVRNASIFSSRPHVETWQFFSAGYRNSLSSPYGSHWQKLRRILNRVLSPEAVENYAEVRRTEREKTLSSLREMAKVSENSIVEPAPIVRLQMSSILMRVCFGDEFEREWENDSADGKHSKAVQMEEFCDRIMAMGSVAHLSDYVPFTRYLPSTKNLYERYRGLENEVINFVMPTIKRKRQAMSSPSSQTPGRKSFLEILVSLDGEDKLTDVEVLWNLMELMVGGTDTSGETVHWALAHLIANPDKQRILYEEIASVVPEGEELQETVVLEKMPYLRALVKETLRISSMTALGVPHATSQDCKLAGYDIPANTQVIFHAGALGNDPTIWDSPSEFRPERFLTGDLTETQKLAFIPFGGGRRICPGMYMGVLHVHLSLASLIQQFEWLPADPTVPLDLSDKLQFMVVLKKKLRASIKERRKTPKA